MAGRFHKSDTLDRNYSLNSNPLVAKNSGPLETEVDDGDRTVDEDEVDSDEDGEGRRFILNGQRFI